jgi:NAD(P)-dependent dehydrogenase (short-subunit alcohol dehydrogenase family)
MNPTVLIVGASRGLGQAIAAEYLSRGSRVVATIRGTKRTPLHELAEGAHGDRLEIEELDITADDEIRALRTRLEGRSFDLLFVNAGIAHELGLTAADVPADEFAQVMITNALSPMRVLELLGDLVTGTGILGVMSSGQGSVANNSGGGWELYRASKAALNQLMSSFAARHLDGPRTLLLMAPGWVKTGLGGPGAKLTIEESVPSLVATIEAQRGIAGLQFLDYQGRTVPW